MNFNQEEKTLFLDYQHSLRQNYTWYNGNPDKEEVSSLEDEEVIIPCIYKYEKLFVPKQLCQNYLRSDSIVKENFREKHLNIKMDKMIKINRLEYLELESLVNELRLLVLKRGTDEGINFNRRRFIRAYENQIKILVDSKLLGILFRKTSYKEFEKYWKNGKYIYKGFTIKSFRNDNKTIGILVNDEERIQFSLKDVLSTIDEKHIDRLMIKNLVINNYCYYFSGDINNSTKEEFIDEKNLIKLFMELKLESDIKNLYSWFGYIEEYLSGLEVSYNIKISKDNSILLETFAKANSLSVEEAISKILLNYINKIVKIEYGGIFYGEIRTINR